MPIKQYDIWIADLNPRVSTEAGKTRPVLILQNNLLNQVDHPSTIVCPMTTKIQKDADILRVFIEQESAGLHADCDIMIDQIRAIDNNRLIKKIGRLSNDLIFQVQDNLRIILDLDESLSEDISANLQY